MIYFHHPTGLGHDPRLRMPGHPEEPGRLEAIERRLEAAGWLGWERRVAPAAQQELLELVHSRDHVKRIEALAHAGGGAIEADTFVLGEPSWEAALHAAGAACAMVRALMAGEASRGFCGVRPPGHHAEPETAMGFCLFNNVAIAAELALRELGAGRVLILDWDVHHGNGTAETFRRRDDVLYVSIHQAGIYPGTGALEDVGSGPGSGYTINLPVPGGSEEGLWLSLLEHVALPAALAFGPDLVLISAGFDAHRDDPLGGCRLEAASFAEMARQVRVLADRLQVPIGAVLEGGYAPAALAESVQETMSALVDAQPPCSVAPQAPLVERAIAQLAPHWPL
ncbi:MAG TPA: histone deacetylase [Solirubrobacteraceae bacterium]|jgi:acetoin utilization deacetylase AcuC-like enzyme